MESGRSVVISAKMNINVVHGEQQRTVRIASPVDRDTGSACHQVKRAGADIAFGDVIIARFLQIDPYACSFLVHDLEGFIQRFYRSGGIQSVIGIRAGCGGNIDTITIRIHDVYMFDLCFHSLVDRVLNGRGLIEILDDLFLNQCVDPGVEVLHQVVCFFEQGLRLLCHGGSLIRQLLNFAGGFDQPVHVQFMDIRIGKIVKYSHFKCSFKVSKLADKNDL